LLVRWGRQLVANRDTGCRKERAEQWKCVLEHGTQAPLFPASWALGSGTAEEEGPISKIRRYRKNRQDQTTR
jgi:hypothetical protein